MRGVPAQRQGPAPLLAVAAILTIAFVLVGRWGPDANPDTAAVAIPAWSLVTQGDLDLSNYEGPLPWAVEVDDALYSNRPPGLIALAVPAYAVTRPPVFSNGPATAGAIILTLGAIAVTWYTIRPLTSPRFAAAATLVYALGTTTWTISSAQLWPHGPGQLLLASAVLTLAKERHTGAGAFFGLEILVRPLTAVSAATTGVLQSLRARSIRPALEVGVPSLVGLGILLAYNRWLFGEWSIRGGYDTTFTSGAIERFDISSYLRNLADMFALPPNGLLLWTPVLAVAWYGTWRFHDRVPGWAKSAAWAGLAYLLVHAALNRASGGLTMLYRYPLEAIALAAPALAIGAYAVFRGGGLWHRALVWAASVSLALQVIGATLITCSTFGADALICDVLR